MNALQGLLAGIVADPLEETRWLVLADWLGENDDPRRGELLRLHRRLLATCCTPDAHPDRAAWQAGVVELLDAGVSPCVPRETLTLPRGIRLTASFVPPGSFLMGGTVEAVEQPVHEVTIPTGSFMGETPVTQEQWKAVMGTEPSAFRGPERPVERVTWYEASEFCARVAEAQDGRVTVDLPAEAEWEYACRAGTTTDFHFGDVPTTDRANYQGTSTWNGGPVGVDREETTDVNLFPPNAWGLYDVHGNVMQWCRDEFDTYRPADRYWTPYEGSGGDLIMRGGAWTHRPDYCRSAYRCWGEPGRPSSAVGFRVRVRPR
jgi:uncharacterized protein (TIGR02996 family)